MSRYANTPTRFCIKWHRALGRAVWTTYGWPEPPGEANDETILSRLLTLNLERAG
jgi:hypothetical protein